MSERAVWALALVTLAGACCGVHAQGVSDVPLDEGAVKARAAEPAAPQATGLDAWRERMAALSPDAPEMYLLLAEEMLDGATDPVVVRFATELLARAVTFGHASGDTATASSAALALADGSSDPATRRALRGLAKWLEPRLAPAAWNEARQATNAGSTDYQIAVAIGNARSGLGQFVRQALRRPEVSTRADATSPMLEQMGLMGGRDWIERTARGWPCPECSNALLTRRGNERRLCGTCKGMPGPVLGLEEYVATLRAELFLLRGDESEWSRQIVMDGGEPLQLLDVASVARLYNIDASKGYFRGGKWTTNADGTDPVPVAPDAVNTETVAIPPTQGLPEQPASPAPQPMQPVQPAPQPAQPAPALPVVPVPAPQPTNPSEDPLPGEEPIKIPTLPPGIVPPGTLPPGTLPPVPVPAPQPT